MSNEEVENGNIIDCVGVDNILHCCVAWKDETICGVKVKKKFVGPNEITKYKYWCCQCDYTADELEWEYEASQGICKQ